MLRNTFYDPAAGDQPSGAAVIDDLTKDNPPDGPMLTLQDGTQVPWSNVQKVSGFKANGAAREVSGEEGVSLLEKAYGADAQFQAAAAATKAAEVKTAAAEKALQLQTDLEAVSSGDQEALRRLATDHFNMPPEEVDRYLQQHSGGSGAGADGKGAAETAAADGVLTDPRYMQLARKVQALEKVFTGLDEKGINLADALQQSQDFQSVLANEKSTEIIKSALTADPIYGRMVRDSKAGPKVLQRITSLVRGRVNSGAVFNSATIQDVLKEEKEALAVFDRTHQPMQSSDMHPGSMGSTPTSDAGPNRLQPPTQPKREDFDQAEDGFRDYMRAKLAFSQWEQTRDT